MVTAARGGWSGQGGPSRLWTARACTNAPERRVREKCSRAPIIVGGGPPRPAELGQVYSATQCFAAASSLAWASTQRAPSGVSSSFQNGALVLSQSIRK